MFVLWIYGKLSKMRKIESLLAKFGVHGKMRKIEG